MSDSGAASRPSERETVNTVYIEDAERTASTKDVGILPDPRNALKKSRTNRDQNSNLHYVFISQTEQDDVRTEISRPTAWFLREHLRVKVFLDETNIYFGDKVSRSLAQAAYECTHALPILSAQYRHRKWCVKELNTFMHRTRVEGEDSIIVMPVLWKLSTLKGYGEGVKDLSRVEGRGVDPAKFLVQTLWPALAKRLHHRKMKRYELSSLLSRFVDDNFDQVPDSLKIFMLPGVTKSLTVSTLMLRQVTKSLTA